MTDLRRFCALFALLWGGAAFGAVRYWHPTTTDADGKFCWNVDANWIDGQGTSGQPADGDTVVLTNAVTVWKVRSDICLDGLILRPLKSGLGLSGACPRFAAGAAGIRLETSRSLNFWLSVAAPADYDLPIYVCDGGTLSFTEKYTGAGRFLKQGTGTLALGSKAWSDGRYAWGGTVIEAGTVSAGASDMRLTDHAFVFSGDDSSARLDLKGNQTLVNVDFHETNGVANTAHAISSATAATLAFTGTPRRPVTAFTGRLLGSLNLRWAPETADRELVLSNAVSTTTGRLEIVRGTVRLAGGACLEALACLELSTADARLVVEAESRIAATRVALASGAVLDLAEGVRLDVPLGALAVGDAVLPKGVYSRRALFGSTSVDWIAGDGFICVGGAVPKVAADAYLDADGWYVFGNPDWLAGKSLSSSLDSWYTAMDLPDFDALYFPPDAKIRFRGGLLFRSFPEGVSTVDWSGCEGFGLVDGLASPGRTFHVSAGQTFWFMPSSSVSVDSAGTLTRTLAAKADTAARTLDCDVALDGNWFQNVSTCGSGSIVHAGRLSGSGTMTLVNYYVSYEHTGDWAFNGTISQRQAGNHVTLKSASVSGQIARIAFGGTSFAGTPSLFRYAPSAVDAPPLSVAAVELSGAGGVNAATADRYGCGLSVASGRAIHVGTLRTSANDPAKALHICAAPVLKTDVQPGTASGEVVVGNITAASYVNLYDAVDFTVSNVLAATTFAFTAESNKVNAGTFAVKGSVAEGTRLLARTPQMLPASVSGYAGRTEIEGDSWNLVLDFDRLDACARTVGDDWNYGANGTMVVTWIRGMLVPGRHVLLRFPAGSPLADPACWSAVLAAGRSQLLTLERTSTELAVCVGEGQGRVTYHVDAENGDDAADGLTPDTAWRTLARVNAADIWPGDEVLFRRGGLWRGQLVPKNGNEDRPVRYAAYGTGPKPILQGSVAADAEGDWELVSPGIWRTTATFSVDVGNIIFNHGAVWGWKTYALASLVSQDLHHYWYNRQDQRVYLRQDENPATVWDSIELALKRHVVNESHARYVTYEDLGVRYGAAHGFGGGAVQGITIRQCDISWIGGGVQEWRDNGEGGESPVRYGNGIEFWDDARDCVVESNRVWEIYDAALTTQGHGDGIVESNIVYRGNVVWNSEYSFEMWTNPSTHEKPALCMDLYITNNTAVDAGCGWAHAQRPDKNGAHLMFYGHSAPTINFVVRDNVFAYATEWYCRTSTDNRALITIDHNLVWMDVGLPYCRYMSQGTAPYADFSHYVNQTGWDRTSLNAAPRFVDPSSRDYRLLRGSPGANFRADGRAVGAFEEAFSRGVLLLFY